MTSNESMATARQEAGDGGRRLVNLTVGATVVFVVVAVAAIVFTGVALELLRWVSLVLFAIGCVVFLAAFFRAINRSRTEYISVIGVYLLSGAGAPRSVRGALLGATLVQTVVAIVAASVHPFTAAAFGILVPMFGLGMSGLWGATHGTFEMRPAAGQKGPTSEAQP